MQLATQRNFCLIQRKTGQFIAIFGIWNRKRTESVRRFNRRFAHTLKLATEPNRGSVRFEPTFGSVPFFRYLELKRTEETQLKSRICDRAHAINTAARRAKNAKHQSMSTRSRDWRKCCRLRPLCIFRFPEKWKSVVLHFPKKVLPTSRSSRLVAKVWYYTFESVVLHFCGLSRATLTVTVTFVSIGRPLFTLAN